MTKLALEVFDQLLGSIELVLNVIEKPVGLNEPACEDN